MYCVVSRSSWELHQVCSIISISHHDTVSMNGDLHTTPEVIKAYTAMHRVEFQQRLQKIHLLSRAQFDLRREIVFGFGEMASGG